jgi:hypothetical protein
MAEATAPNDEAAEARAVRYILQTWGSLRDLPAPLIPVVWVVTYQALKLAMTVEARGGQKALLENTLLGDETLAPAFEEATARISLLREMIPLIRSQTSQGARLADAHLVIDVLKWSIEDAAEISPLRRTFRRIFSKAHKDYRNDFPREILD